MEWSTPSDAEFLGDDAAGALASAAAVDDLLGWPDGLAMRYRTRDGSAAWLRLTKTGALHCCAIAPWDDRFAADWVADADMFDGLAWPATWRTKRTVGIRQLPTPHNDWAVFAEGGFACGMLVNKHAILCKVIALGEDGALAKVQPTPDGPELAIADMPHVRRWFGLTKWPDGCAALWEGGIWQFHNYPLLTIRASLEQAKAEGRPIRRGKKAVEAAAAPLPPRDAQNPLSQAENPGSDDTPRQRVDAFRAEHELPPITEDQWADPVLCDALLDALAKPYDPAGSRWFVPMDGVGIKLRPD